MGLNFIRFCDFWAKLNQKNHTDYKSMSIPNDLKNAVANITKITWILWVLVCGVSPVLLSMAGYLLDADIKALHISMSLAWFLLLGLPLTIPFLQCFVLRRFAPRLDYSAWFFSVSVAGIIALFGNTWARMYLLQPQISTATL